MFVYQTTGSQWLFWLYLAFFSNSGIYRCKICVMQKTCAPHAVTISTTISSSSLSSYLSSLSSTPTCTSIHTIETYIHLLNYYYHYNRGGQTDGQIHYIYLNFYLKILFIVMKKIKRIGDLQKIIHSVKLFCIKFIYLWITWKRKKTKNTVLK